MKLGKVEPTFTGFKFADKGLMNAKAAGKIPLGELSALTEFT